MSHDAVDVWPRVQQTLKDELPLFQYNSWVRDLGLVDIDENGVAALAAPDALTCNWVSTYYREPLLGAFAKNDVAVTGLQIRSSTGSGAVQPPEAPAVGGLPAGTEPAGAGAPAGSFAGASASVASRPVESPGRVPVMEVISPHATPAVGTARVASCEPELVDQPETAGAWEATCDEDAAAAAPSLDWPAAGRSGLAPDDDDGEERFRDTASFEVRELRTGASFVLNGGYTFDNFVTGPCNRLPHAAASAVAEAPGRCYNPLFIHGNVGLGKTHLLQAICAKLLTDNPETSILYLSCEEFINQFIEAVERGELDQFRHRYRHVDVLIIDDIHFLANKERTQEEFFHTFNTLYNAQKQIVLSSDAPPVEIPTIEDRLVSRFKWGLVTMIESPAFETRTAILKKKARLQGIDLPDNCLQFLAENLDSSIREIEGAITRVASYSRMVERPIDLTLIKESLRDLLSMAHRKVSIQSIIDMVCSFYEVKLSDLQSKARKQSITFPRQICMYLARKHTKHSLEEIGGYFGGRDHTTVLHADEKIRRLLVEDVSLKTTVDRLESKLRA